MWFVLKLVRYAVEFALFFTVFVIAFVAYLMRSEPTKFIYYNF
jgi:hypothetical protein